MPAHAFLTEIVPGGGGGSGTGSPDLGVYVEDFGAIGDGLTNDRDAIQAAATAVGVQGTVYFDSRKTYYLGSGGAIDVPSDAIGVTFQGNGCTLKLSVGCPTAFRQARNYLTLSTQEFKNITIENFNINGNNVGGQYTAVIFGSAQFEWSQRTSFDNINIRNVTSYNVPAGISPIPGTNPTRGHIMIISTHPDIGMNAVQTHMTNILCENVKMYGGNHGINVTGANDSGGTGDKNIHYNNVTLRDCVHDTMQDYTGFPLVFSSNYQIGSGAYGGTVTLENCLGYRSGDVGVELNQFETANVTDCTFRDAAQCAVLLRNYNATMMTANRKSAQTVTLTNLKMIRDALVITEGSGNLGEGIAIGSGNANIGNVFVRNAQYYVRRQDTLFSGARAIVGVCQNLDVDGLTATWDQINYTPVGTGGSVTVINSGTATQVTNNTIKLNNIKIKMTGTQLNAVTKSINLISLFSNNLQVELTNIELDYNFTTQVAGGNVIMLGNGAGTTINGNIRDVYIRDYTSTSGTVGIRVLTGTAVGKLNIREYDPTGIPNHANDYNIPSAVADKVSLGPVADVANLTNTAFGGKGDYRTVADAAMTISSATLTSATAAFASTDVGKKVCVYGAGAAGAPLLTSITAYTNTTTVTLAAVAATAVSAANMFYATDNFAAYNAASNSVINGGTIYIPSGSFYFDISQGTLTSRDGQLIKGEGSKSIMVFGTEGATAIRTAYQTNTTNMVVKWENLTFQGPSVLGTGGSMWFCNTGGINTKMIFRGCKWKNWSHPMYASGAGATLDAAKCEVEGYGGAYPSRAMTHDGTAGVLRSDDNFFWNTGQTGQTINTIAASTGVDVNISRTRFDLQTGSGYSIFHYDTNVTPPTANKLSRIADCQFGPTLTGIAIRTPYQGICQVNGNDFSSPVTCVGIGGKANVENNNFKSTQTTAAALMIGFVALATPIVVNPSGRINNNSFSGRYTNAIFATANVDLQIGYNDFLGGDSTVSSQTHVRMDAGLVATSRVEVSNNLFGGVCSSFGVQFGGGIGNVNNNRFHGSFSALVASQAGIPARLSLRNNDLSPVAGIAVQFTTTPTLFETKGNFGTLALNDNPGDLTGFNTITAATYTLVAADGGKIVEGNSASAQTFTIPLSTLPVGWSTTINQRGAGLIGIAVTVGVTLETRGGFTHLGGQYAAASLWCRAANVFVLSGDLS